MKTGGYGTTQGESIIDSVTGCKLTVNGAAEIRKVFITSGNLQQQGVADILLNISVYGPVITTEFACIVGNNTLESTGTRTYPGIGFALF